MQHCQTGILLTYELGGNDQMSSNVVNVQMSRDISRYGGFNMHFVQEPSPTTRAHDAWPFAWRMTAL